jgi:putative SOS response-associated peptidase YedK
MPVIYDREMGQQWLDPHFTGSPSFLAAVLQPLPSELMEMRDVSTLVNSPANDSPNCIEAV